MAGDPPAEQSRAGATTVDWPRGFSEASVWPIITALGVAGVYGGVVAYLLGRGREPLVPDIMGPAVLGPAVGLTIAGLYGWMYHGYVRQYWLPPSGDADTLEWGMVLFLVTDMATFGAVFVYYFVARGGPWPPAELPALMSSLVLVNTALLVGSSLTMVYAESSLRDGRRRRFLVGLGTSFVLGALFIGGQALEYVDLLGEAGVHPTGVFFSAFFALTGLHGAHVALGVVMIGVAIVRALLGQFDAERHTAVTTLAMYWHFVDAIWIVLFVSLYLGGTG